MSFLNYKGESQVKIAVFIEKYLFELAALVLNGKIFSADL